MVDNDPAVMIERIYEICPQINSCEDLGKIDVAYVYHLYAGE